ncbi:TrkH family potassium uptake protein [Paramicrobacterium chengjingii]|uniref:TrkH family potassium uptake protein n=1 Tax=Paramicrobacterium chengjingii TaxID=2769067 RepID=A0ABX6YFQ1_9MICO|nr:potassium transporter TrkG [Microbacterium chengjingii]QPZ37505.1 TrkH family potassium uptake protein [Microbacterium chengjingii]
MHPRHGHLPHVTRRRPGILLLIAFAAVIAVGTGLLMLPVSQAGEGSATLIDALFTAVSATCVTGLTVVDTATYWSPFGQVVIILLVQVGGFGVMTFATVLGVVVLRRLSLRAELAVAAEVKTTTLSDVRKLVVGVISISIVVEVLIAAALAARFAAGYGESLGRSLWLGVFHAIASFNNAGFALFTDNAESFVSDPLICLPLCAAVIIGGLGFPVIMQLARYARTPRLWTMNTRIVIVATLVLLIAGTIYITAIEWNNPDTFGRLSGPSKILAGFFQSVQTRSGGLNSVDIGDMHPATLLGMDALMFIGAGPAGTAGGIKVTTFAVLLFIVFTEIRGEHSVNILGKGLARSVNHQATTVVVLATTVLFTASAFILLVTDIDIGRTVFEAISAFGTVGLSTGITASLPNSAQMALIVLMYVGRLGPMAVATALALRQRHIRYELPKERPIIG